MRKFLAVLTALIATLALVAADASAQAPAPKVTINGLVDMVTSWSDNMSIDDLNLTKDDDDEWYARTRLRPDITAELGTTKFVLGLEIDFTWGQTNQPRSGTLAGGFADLNVDQAGIIELKWGYLEFDVPGLAGARLRLGAQPWAVMYKPAVFATGDFGGAHFTWGVTPGIRVNLTYAQIEEEHTGPNDGFTLGEDWAFVGSVEISPFKGLDIRPIYSYARFEGTTSGSSRQGRGGISAGSFTAGDTETRHTLGVDARWRSGPFSFDPTILYQLGERQLGATEVDRSAWLLDLRGGWQAGPLLVEGAFIYTTGNDAGDNLTSDDINYFEPISTDTSFYAGWAEIWALGIDYFNILNSGAAGLNPGVAIGYDRYGLMRLGVRATYALTPTFSVRGALTFNWTAEDVDTDGAITAASGITPADGNGDDNYLGTEIDLGLTWRFAPGVAFDLVGGYMFAGDALKSATSTANRPAGTTRPNNDVEDVKTVAARVRYTF